MAANEETLDRVLRVIAGLAILSLAFVGPQSPWAYLGLVPLLTGIVGFCPAYHLLGVRTGAVRPMLTSLVWTALDWQGD